MTWIKTVPVDKAEGLVKKMYEDGLKRAGKVSQVVQSMSINPDILRTSIRFYSSVMLEKSSLSRVQRELLAVVVSTSLKCNY